MQKQAGYWVAVLTALVWLASVAGAQTWTMADQGTVAWDPVTTMETGSGPVPLPADAEIQYRVFLRAEGDQTNGTEQTAQPIAATEYTVTMPGEGRFYAGIMAVRIVPEGQMVSTISWTADPSVVANGETWGFVHYWPPAMVGGIQPRH